MWTKIACVVDAILRIRSHYGFRPYLAALGDKIKGVFSKGGLGEMIPRILFAL